MTSFQACYRLTGAGGALVLCWGLAAAGPALAAPVDYLIDDGEVVELPGDRPDPWDTGGHLFVGFDGAGELTVADGAEVNAGFTILGNLDDSAGTLTVIGAQTRFNSANGMVFGALGSADVRFANGATISSNGSTLAQEESGEAVMRVEGADTDWNVAATLTVGQRGQADLTIQNADVHSDSYLVLGRYTTGKGTVHLDGGQLSNAFYAAVGQAGEGVVTMSNGARVHTAQGLLGWESTARGELHMTGADTLWSGQGYLFVGYQGEGLATVADGATVRIAPAGETPSLVIIGGHQDARGRVYLGGETTATGAGFLDVQEVRFSGGDGALVFNHTDQGYEFLPVFNGNGLIEHRAGDTVLNGQSTGFSGTARLTGGTLTLAADQALGSGTLELDGGTLATRGTVTLGNALRQLADTTLWAGAGTATFTGALDLGDHLLTVDGDGDTVFSGDISAGAGALEKVGGGRLSLLGDASAYAGLHEVRAGVLAVDGALGGELTVFSGGRLQGNGQVGSTEVRAGGILAPGNSIGALTVDGDLTLTDGAAFEVEVDPAGSAADHLHVTGQATLAGSVVHIGEAGEYRPISRYRILTADGGLVDGFDQVASDFLFLDAALLYDANNVDLELRRNDLNFAAVAETDNQRAVAAGVQSLGAGNVLHDTVALQTGSPAALAAAYDSLSGEVHASAAGALLEDSRLLRDAALERFGDDDRLAAGTTLARGQGVTAWLRAYGNVGQTDGEPGTADRDRDTQGALLGVDRVFTGGGRAGVLLGAGRTDLNLADQRGSADIDSVHAGLFGEYRHGPGALRGGLFYSHHRIDTRRRAVMGGLNESLASDRDADTWQAFVEAAHRFGTTRSVEPFVRLAQVRTVLHGGDEHGGDAALHGARETLDTTFSTLGARLSTTLAGEPTTRLYGSLGWQHALGDTTPEASLRFAGGGAFTVEGAPLARDTLVMEAGFSWLLAPRATLTLGYLGETGDGRADHGGQARFGWSF
ncbi:autotransporter outer membrane beta-barrel domain-containing protein [Alloalcanivorax marinus]|uniref:autotransporter outer membrane beta-barrel domain-containing protein n=1 Tax=Alloalcanivorax marinus TaxID=1177169 RepID=UPI0019325992|nr:autotransporter domain-containing protein [Alloalcanivorax marinus]MBL7250879.1 autotransporter domain-containing protein [Alloalcanivorax marinus]